MTKKTLNKQQQKKRKQREIQQSWGSVIPASQSYDTASFLLLTFSGLWWSLITLLGTVYSNQTLHFKLPLTSVVKLRVFKGYRTGSLGRNKEVRGGKVCHSIRILYKLYSLCSQALRSGREVQQSSVTLDSRSIQPLLESELDKKDQCSQSFDVTE